MIEFAEATFGPNDPKTAFLKKLSPTVEQVVRFRNAVEHPGGHSGVLNIRNFRLEPDGKLSEPCWWTEKDGQKTPESWIGADLGGIINKLLALTELIFVSWAAENLRMPNFLRKPCNSSRKPPRKKTRRAVRKLPLSG